MRTKKIVIKGIIYRCSSFTNKRTKKAVWFTGSKHRDNSLFNERDIGTNFIRCIVSNKKANKRKQFSIRLFTTTVDYKIRGEILLMEMVTQSEATRKRFHYLSHIFFNNCLSGVRKWFDEVSST